MGRQESQRWPQTFPLQRHCPERRPRISSVWASHKPPSRAPTGSQSQAGSGVRARTQLGQRTPWRRRICGVRIGIGGLTFAGVKGTGIFPVISVEEGLAALTVAPSCVMLTCVTHTSTHIARCQVQGHVKVTTAGMPMALTFWGRTREVDMKWADLWRVWPGRVGHLPWQAWGCPGSAACHGWSWYRSWQRSQWVPAVWWRQTQRPCTWQEGGQGESAPVPQFAHPISHGMSLSWRSPCLPHWLVPQVWACTQRHGHGTGSCLGPQTHRGRNSRRGVP